MGWANRAEGARVTVGRPFQDELAHHGNEPQIGSDCCRADELEPERGGSSGGLGVEVVHDFHVVRHEPDRYHDDGPRATGCKLVEPIADVGFEPRRGR
jgi:hypothetical protein